MQHMPGCNWWLVRPDHYASEIALLRTALGPGPYQPGIAGYGAILGALDNPSR